MSTAAASAAPMPQPSPPMALATMNTTTGRPESTMPIGPPICSQMVGGTLGLSGCGVTGRLCAGVRKGRRNGSLRRDSGGCAVGEVVRHKPGVTRVAARAGRLHNRRIGG